MPLNCSKGFLEYNACLDCRHRHENECWGNFPIPQKLADILTIEERIAILEDALTLKGEVLPEPKKWWDNLQQLKSELVGWRKKHAETLLEIDKLKAILTKKPDNYLYE